MPTSSQTGLHRQFPGDTILVPASLVALVVFIVNDDWLKARFHDVLTGKLSDAAGIVFFPILLIALAEVVKSLAGHNPWRVRRTFAIGCIVATGVVFTWAKLWQPGADIFARTLSVSEWPFFALRQAISGGSAAHLPTKSILRDPTDLIVLPLLLVTWLSVRGRCTEAGADQGMSH